MFGDPYYGGNANFVGWDLIGYPGVRTMVQPADQQRLEKNQLTPNHRSAYDFERFNKATARGDGDHEHGPQPDNPLDALAQVHPYEQGELTHGD